MEVNVHDDDESGAFSYLYTAKGLFTAPHWSIHHDHQTPVRVSAKKWREIQNSHQRMNAVTALQNQNITVANVVIMKKPNPQDPGGRALICSWFVRIGVAGGSKAFNGCSFGRSFLWQLPYFCCVRMIQEIQAYEASHSVPEEDSSPLLQHYRPTHHEFNPDEWPDIKKVTALHSYFDAVFAMSIQPSKFPVAAPDENSPARAPVVCRPAKFQTAGLDLTKLPDDVNNLILQNAAERWVASPLRCDWKALLALRQVSKGTKRIVEESAENFMTGLFEGLKNAIKCKDHRLMFPIRDRILNAGLVTLSVILEGGTPPSFLGLMRLRSNRRAGEQPPNASPSDVKRLRSDETCYGDTSPKSTAKYRRCAMGSVGKMNGRR